MRALAIIAILTTVTLAGCASNGPEPALAGPHDDPLSTLEDLSQKVFDILPVVEEWVTMDDGQRMHNAVYRPDTNQTVPVFINFSPYWGDSAELGGDAFSQYMIDEYVPRGYAVVLNGIRGTGHSEGCFSIGGDRELQDMHEVVDHYANVPWSNGNIAAGGKSYDSTTQNGMIAKFPHPALKGIFHVSGISDMYAYNYKGGVPYATGAAFNTYYYLQGTDEYGVSLVSGPELLGGNPPGAPMDEDAESLLRVIDDAACVDLPFVQAHGVGSGVTGLKTDYWVERDWTRFIGDSDWNGSIFFVHGLQDWNVKPDHILPWIDNLPEQIRVKGWLHQAGHVYPERTDWNQTMLRWMDHDLKGIDTGLWDEPRWEVRSDNGDWYQHEAWPPEGLALDGSAIGVPLTTTALGYTVLVQNDTHISGSVRIAMDISYDSNPAAVVTATLYDVGLDGSRTYVSEGVLRAIYREGLESPAVDVPIGFYPMTLDLYPADHVFQAGNTMEIRLQEAPRQALVAPPQTENIRIEMSDVWWPVASSHLMAEQPADMRCFTC